MEGASQGQLRRIVFAVEYLPPDCPNYWEAVHKFAMLGSGPSLDVTKVKMVAENLQMLDEQALATDKFLGQQLRCMSHGKSNPIGIVLISKHNDCLHCGGKLITRTDRPSKVTIYTESQGTVLGSHFHKLCQNSNKGCKFIQYYGYYSVGTESLYYNTNVEDLSFIVSTNMTAFEISLLKRFDFELLIGEISYKQKAEIYNCVNGYDDVKKTGYDDVDRTGSNLPTRTATLQEEEVMHRLKLDRRRLEEAHLKYAIISVTGRYLPECTHSTIKADLFSTLDAFTPTYFNWFTSKYAAHKCQIPGCASVLVLDGNMKNRRVVCNARDAGYIEYPGLPGKIKTGCMKTPRYASKYCKSHEIRSCNLTVSPNDPDLPQSMLSDKDTAGAPVVEMILNKKTLREKVLYEVLWIGHSEVHTTWEVAEVLSATIIKEFEDGLRTEAQEDHMTAYGTDSFTLTTTSHTRPSAKKPSIERPVLEETTGVFQEEPTDLSCNTLKDRNVPKTSRNAGILAGIWPSMWNSHSIGGTFYSGI